MLSAFFTIVHCLFLFYSTVIIRNIPFATTDEELVAFVKEQKLAVPADLKIQRTASGKSRGIAHYVCENDAQIDEVCAALNGKTIGERELRVRRSPKLVENKLAVVVKNIPRTMDKGDYEAAVQDFGVPAPKTLKYRTVSSNRGRGVMVFATEDAAKSAVAAVDKKPFGQRSARARQLVSKNTVVVVLNIPYKMQDEEFLKTVGELGVSPESACVLFPHCTALYTYESEADAEKALAAFAGKKLAENELHAKHPISRAPSAPKGAASKQDAPKAARDAKREGKEAGKGAGKDFVTLRVTNLPKGIADEDVVEIFRGAKVAGTKLEDTKNGVAAFVDFRNERDARAAHKLVKGTTVNGAALHITLLRYAPPKSAESSTAPSLPETTIRVYNLPFASTDDDVVAALKEYGAVSAKVLRTRFGKSRGVALVDFGSVEDCKRVADAEVVMDDRTLRFRGKGKRREQKSEDKEVKPEEKKAE